MKITAEIELTPAQIAACIAPMNDEDQAEVIIELARIAAETWDGDPCGQWYSIGRHLATCSCSTLAARDLIRGIIAGIDSPLAAWEVKKMCSLGGEIPYDLAIA